MLLSKMHSWAWAKQICKNEKKIFSDESGTRNQIFGVPTISGKMGLRLVEQGFYSFFANFFGAYLMIFQYAPL